MDRMINYIRLVLEFTCMLRTYRTYNSTVKFSKYEFNNKLLDYVTLFRVCYIRCNLNSTPYIYIERERERMILYYPTWIKSYNKNKMILKNNKKWYGVLKLISLSTNKK